MSASSRVLKNTVFYTLGNLVPQILGFILLPVFTSYLSREDYGILNYTATVGLYLSQVCIFGFNTYLLRHYFLCESEAEKRRMFGSIISLVFSYNLVLMLLLHFISPFLIDRFDISVAYYPYFFISFLGLFFENFTVFPLILYRVKENALMYFMVSVTKVLFKYLLSIILIVQFDQGVMGRFYSELYVNIAFFVLYFFLIRREVDFVMDGSTIKKAIRFSAPFLVSAIMFLITDNSDRFFLERHVGLAELGVFSISVTIYNVYFGFTQSMYRSLEPTLYRKYNEPGFSVEFLRIKEVYFFAAIGVATFAGLFSKEILGIMANPKFAAAAEIVPLLLLVGVIFGFQTLHNVILTAARPKHVLLVTATGSICILVGNAFLIQRYGVWGAGLSKLFAFGAMGLVSAWLVNRCMDGVLSGNLKIAFGIVLMIAMFSIVDFGFDGIPYYVAILVKSAVLLLNVLFLGKLCNIKLHQLFRFYSAKVERA